MVIVFMSLLTCSAGSCVHVHVAKGMSPRLHCLHVGKLTRACICLQPWLHVYATETECINM